ncbi:hypothetical protein V8E51_016509 [Hyaloscypha variabilis]
MEVWEENVAELVAIGKQQIDSFLATIGGAIRRIVDKRDLSRTAPEKTTVIASSVILEDILPGCEMLLEHFGTPIRRPPTPPPARDVLILCRTLAFMLDLGLVSYIDCHASRFDTDSIGRDCSETTVTPPGGGKIGFRFSLMKLNCLNGFLNHQPIWVFQKRLPCTTQKQAIWNKWKFQAKKGNPSILNSYLGVEISNCTRNARRVKLRDLFTMPPIQDVLMYQFPDWLRDTGFGESLQAAFSSETDGDIVKVWTDYWNVRDQMAEIVCYVLELLEKTGNDAGTFNVVFLNRSLERSMPLDLRLNSWTGFLEDSHLMAVYAIVNEVCFDGGELGHNLATCKSFKSPAAAFAVFETMNCCPVGADKQRKTLHRPTWVPSMGQRSRQRLSASDLGDEQNLRARWKDWSHLGLGNIPSEIWP